MKIFSVFLQALSWNALGALAYKFFLLTHQFILFKTIDTSLYGQVGTIFSGIYFLISITNFGFEYTFFPLFEKLSHSKNHARIFIQYCYIRIAIGIFVGIISFLLGYNIPYIFGFLGPTIAAMPLSLLIIGCGIIIAEAIKKSCMVIMQLSFQNKISSFLEVSSLILYIALIWGTYFFTHSISMYLLLAALLFAIIIEIIGSFWFISKWYYSLPEISLHISIPTREILHQQFYNYLNQLIKALFSPNYLLLLASSQLGFFKVGVIKLITEVIGFLYTFFHKTIALAAGATFIQINKEKDKTIAILFYKITGIYSWVVQLSVWTCCLLQYYISAYEYADQNFVILMLIFISMIEYMMLPYEKLFITKSAAKALTLCNSISVLLYIISLISGLIATFYVLPSLFFIRYITLILYAHYLAKHWHVFTPSKIWIPIHAAAILVLVVSYLYFYTDIFIKVIV